MPLTRWLELRDSKVLAVHGNASCLCIELDGYIHQWEGSGASRCGTGWVQRVRIEIDFPEADQGISVLPATLSGGTASFDAMPKHRNGGLTVPMALETMVTLELVATSTEKLKVSGERIRTSTSGDARFVDALAEDLDPARR